MSSLISDIVRKQLDEFFPDKKYDHMIERIQKDPSYEHFLVKADIGVSDLVRNHNMSSRGVEIYIRNLTKHYITAYLEALEPVFKDD